MGSGNPLPPVEPGRPAGDGAVTDESEARAAAKEGRLRRHWRLAHELRAEPRLALSWMRAALLRVWQARGGGFFGLGYIIAFVVFEVQLLTGEILESDGAADFAFGQLLEYLFRVGFMSFVIAFKALLWPVFVLEVLGAAGIIALLLGYVAFERLLRPAVERVFPELREHRENREQNREQKGQSGRRGRRNRNTRSETAGAAGTGTPSNGTPTSPDHNQ